MQYCQSTYQEEYASFVGNAGADLCQPQFPGVVTGLLNFLVAGDKYYPAH